MEEFGEGPRYAIEMPSGERYYLLCFPHAPTDFFSAKVPFENRPENWQERQAIDRILECINMQVHEIHAHYEYEIAELRQQIESFEKLLGLDKPRAEHGHEYRAT